MKVVRAAEMGMCFGVRDALEIASRIQNPAQVTIYGELVHNPAVSKQLSERGFQFLPETGRDVIPSTSAVMVTAHGISERTRYAIESSGKTIFDTTCPLVRRAHDAALRLHAAGYFVIVIGRDGHVEVTGLTEDLNHFVIISDVTQAVPLPYAKLGVICQTTTQPTLAREIIAAIRFNNPDAEIKVIDTICRPTRERQVAMRELLPLVDAVVVVGGTHSNNTRQLATMAQQHGVPVCHVQSAAELREEWFAGMQTIGLTAGTSTLDATIDEVEFVLEAIEAGCF
ncbi:MAG: 4-hydroxy-3-methylbut-2-enyl diphosphate reductase [Candidatus Sumerlaeaceae bacterium]